jgi:hypothetical protein
MEVNFVIFEAILGRETRYLKVILFYCFKADIHEQSYVLRESLLLAMTY